MSRQEITFSFGKNWENFLRVLNDERLSLARRDIEEYLGEDCIKGASVIDIGSGSGIHSSCFFFLEAERVVSIDIDPRSVNATRLMWEKSGKPSNWSILEGSILDNTFIQSQGNFDIVYSWGVLHHTGMMWQALENAFSLVKPGGKIMIALYAKGPKYAKHLAEKEKYNRSSSLGKKMMEAYRILWLMYGRARQLKNPFTWNETRYRGMNVYHDLVDWLGGLPYEVASDKEIIQFGNERGFIPDHIKIRGEGANNIYVFHLPA